MTSNVLATLLSPLESQDFFNRYWGKEFLICKGTAERFHNLFSWETLSTVLSTHRLEYPRLRLVRAGKLIPPSDYIVMREDRRGRVYSTHDPQAVASFLKAGAMLHITSIGETHKDLAVFAARLEHNLDARIQVNLHAGFAASRGFDTHWDGHDVFAIQMAGRKKWRMFGITDEAPLAVPPDQKQGAPTQTVWEGILDAGDVLYIPRGYWHSAEAIDDATLHLTFAVQYPTGADFLNWLVLKVKDDVFIRKDMPVPFWNGAALPSCAPEHEYLEGLRSQLFQSISLEMLQQFVANYRVSLGRVNHIDLKPLLGGIHDAGDSI